MNVKNKNKACHLRPCGAGERVAQALSDGGMPY